MNDELDIPNPEGYSNSDLSWVPNNPYNYTFLESLMKITYNVSKPFVKIYSYVTGIPAGASLTWLSINLLSYVRGYNKSTKDLLWKQAVLETGGFVSPMSVTDNNQFGMHLPNIRPTTTFHFRFNSSENSYVSIYSSVFDSVLDRMLWDDYNSIPRNIDPVDYQNNVVDNGYNENPDSYAQAWNSAEMPTPPLVIVIYLAVLLTILLLIKKFFF